MKRSKIESEGSGFINGSARSQWLELPQIVVYLRKSKRTFDHVHLAETFDISSVYARVPGHGAYKKFVEKLRTIPDLSTRFQYIYAENVMSKRFEKWFKKNKWIRIEPPYPCSPPCYYLPMERFVSGER